MKNNGKYLKEFLGRGLIAMGFGPLTLAIIYYILYLCNVVSEISVTEMVLGIVTISILAFLAGGINVVYKIEELAISKAITIHGIVLYACYISVYLINGWVKENAISLLIFTAIFVVGYLLVWLVIYLVTKRKTDNLNKMFKS